MNLEGKLLGNRYELIEKIGNGGMATVYKAKCHVLNRYVAVKILRDEFTTDEEFIKRFNVEAQAVACFSHPNIVSVYDVGNEGNLYYIVMELVKGKTLKEIIVEDGAIGWKWSVKVAIQIASALETAHKNGIIHRDIKPHNIIITEDGIAKVTDFGIAKAVSNSTITAFGTTIGSVHYFSPEHAKGRNTDEKSDLYSLGVVMYEMVTGRVPFDADTPVSVALKHMQEEPVEPIVINPEIPLSVNKIIMKAMQKDPELRYANATEMLKDLNRALKNPEEDFVYIPTEHAVKQESSRHSEDKPKKKQKFSKMKKYFEEHPIMKGFTMIFIAIFVMFAVGFGTYEISSLTKKKDVQLPNLVGLTLEEAETKAKEVKLKVEVKEERYDLTVEEGKIIEQDPGYQNIKVKEKSSIKVVISKGQEIVKTEKVIGKKKDEAKKSLEELGLIVQIEEEYSDTVEDGIVIKQSIDADVDTPAGTTIILTVSKGIEQIEVPDLSGKTEEEAKATLTNAKLKWKSTTKVNDSSKPNGVVVDQNISKGSKVDKDTEITITVNEFDETKSATVNVNVKSLNGYEEKHDVDGGLIDPGTITLKITVNDEQIEQKIVSKASTNESVSFEGSGNVTIKVYIDGNKKAEKTINLNSQTSITID